MATKLSAIDQLQALKDEFEKKAAKVKDEALSELREELKAAQQKVSDIEEQIAELTGKPVKEASGRTRMNKAAKTIAVKKLYEAIGRKAGDAKSSTELMAAIGADKSSWQTISKEIIGLTKVGDKTTAKWYVKG